MGLVGWVLLSIGFLIGTSAIGVGLEGSRVNSLAAQSRATRNRGRENTWTARSTTGRILSGTWTAVPDPSTGTATGTWTVFDSQGRTSARGTWSASKSPTEWSGIWRASVAGSPANYTGTWTADADLGADAPLASLFERAATDIVSGTWRVGAASGSWSIRAFGREP